MRWISVKEFMPIKGVDVQVFCEDTREQFVGFSLGDGRFQFAQAQDGSAIVCRPSHWSELYAAPDAPVIPKFWTVDMVSEYYVMRLSIKGIPGSSTEMAGSYAVSLMANPDVWRVTDIELG